MQNRTHMDTGATSSYKIVSDARRKMIEHIVAQYDRDDSTDVRQILNETKVGGRRRSNIMQMIRTVFSGR